ncbi:MAG: hypothetical protein AAGI44_19175 [Pseudomonadota bacterium]
MKPRMMAQTQNQKQNIRNKPERHKKTESQAGACNRQVIVPDTTPTMKVTTIKLNATMATKETKAIRFEEQTASIKYSGLLGRQSKATERDFGTVEPLCNLQLLPLTMHMDETRSLRALPR